MVLWCTAATAGAQVQLGNEVLASGASLESKASEGGTASQRVREQLSRAKEVLEEVTADAEA